MTIAVGTSPARVDGASTSSSATTASFTAPAGSVLVALVVANSSTNGTTTDTVTDTPASGSPLVWARRSLANFATVAASGFASIWTAYAPTAVARTVNVTTAGSTSTTRRPSIKVYVVTDADETDLAASSGAGTSTTNSATFNFTSAADGSYAFVAASEWQKRGVPTSSDLTGEFFDQSGADGVSAVLGYKSLGSAGSESFNCDAFGTSAAAWNVARLELRAARPPDVSAGADVPAQVVGTEFSRTATAVMHGGAISAHAWTIVSGPDGAGTTIGTAAALSWTPTVTGTYVLRYSATVPTGTATDDVTVEVVDAVGVDFLPELADSKVSLEVAWGADLTADPDTWTWTDVTEDVRTDAGLPINRGRNDEASKAQPATLKATLDNTAAAYSLGGHSPNWPNVRRGTPVRARVAIDGTIYTRFQGYADGWTPGWATDGGQVPTVDLEASGVLRRLGQGKDPELSALYRHYTLASSPVEAWPLEEDTGAANGASVTGGGLALISGNTLTLEDLSTKLVGTWKWGGFTDNPAAARAPSIGNGAGLNCPVRSGLFGSQWSVSWSMRVPFRSGPLLRFRTDVPGGAEVFIDWNTLSDVDISSLVNNTVVSRMTFSMGDPADFDGLWHDYVLTIDNSSGSAWAIYMDGVQMDTFSGSALVGRPTALDFYSYADDGSTGNPIGQGDPIGLAGVAVWNELLDPAAHHAAAQAHRGETADERIERLAAENGIPIEVTGASTTAMGWQAPAGVVDLILECETADQGVLYDGAGPGLTYVCRDQRENAEPALETTAASLVAPFAPVDDDQRTRNLVTASQAGTQFRAVHEDVDGPLGTATVGEYSGSVTVNLADPGDVEDYAGWLVHLGTVEGYRYPRVTLNLRSTPALAADVAALGPSARVVVAGLGASIAALGELAADLLVEGVTETLSPFGWGLTLKCSPYGPWRVGLAADDTDDEDPELLRADTDGSTVNSSALAGATTLSAATAAGPLWSTTGDDYPLDLDVGGVRVTATACSGATSPQTFTVAALPTARAAGLPVKLWDPAVPGL